MSFDNLCAYSGSKQLLHNVSGTLHPRSMMLLGGPSGAGKTVFLNALTGRSGKLRVEGSVTLQPHEFVYVRTHTEYYTRTFTVFDEVCFSARMFAGGKVKIEQIDGVLESVGMTEFKDKYVGELSSGQRKRLSIACALTKPNVRCLILDEPTSNLDSNAAVAIIEAIHNTIRRMNGVSVICSVHQPSSLILSYFDTAILLCRGHCVYQGPMGEQMYTSLQQYSSNCVDYESVQFALSQDHTETTSLYAQWSQRVSTAVEPVSKRQTLKNQVMSSIRNSVRLNFERNASTTTQTYFFQLKLLVIRAAALFIKDWRREIARILLIFVGFIVGSAVLGRPTFSQNDVLHVIACIRGVAYYQGMTGISRVVNRHESDKIAKDCIDNGMFTRGQYETVMFLNILVAAMLASFVTAVVCAWLYASFTFEFWIAYVFYFCYVDTMYSLNILVSDSITVASIGTLTILLVCFASPIDSVIIPVTEIFRYSQSAVMGDISWDACKANSQCYGGPDGCLVLDVVTFSECGQPVTSTLVCSAVWTVIQLMITRFIRIR